MTIFKCYGCPGIVGHGPSQRIVEMNFPEYDSAVDGIAVLAVWSRWTGSPGNIYFFTGKNK